MSSIVLTENSIGSSFGRDSSFYLKLGAGLITSESGLSTSKFYINLSGEKGDKGDTGDKGKDEDIRLVDVPLIKVQDINNSYKGSMINLKDESFVNYLSSVSEYIYGQNYFNTLKSFIVLNKEWYMPINERFGGIDIGDSVWTKRNILQGYINNTQLINALYASIGTDHIKELNDVVGSVYTKSLKSTLDNLIYSEGSISEDYESILAGGEHYYATLLGSYTNGIYGYSNIRGRRLMHIYGLLPEWTEYEYNGDFSEMSYIASFAYAIYSSSTGFSSKYDNSSSAKYRSIYYPCSHEKRDESEPIRIPIDQDSTFAIRFADGISLGTISGMYFGVTTTSSIYEFGDKFETQIQRGTLGIEDELDDVNVGENVNITDRHTIIIKYAPSLGKFIVSVYDLDKSRVIASGYRKLSKELIRKIYPGEDSEELLVFVRSENQPYTDFSSVQLIDRMGSHI